MIKGGGIQSIYLVETGFKLGAAIPGNHSIFQDGQPHHHSLRRQHE